MARTNNLTNFLNDVATAIKTKLGDSTAIPAAQFDSKIMDIHTGGTYQTKSISITTNGNYTQLPDTGFDAMDQVVISVSVSPILQNKTVTENGSYTADQNYDGLGTVIVNVVDPEYATNLALSYQILGIEPYMIEVEKITSQIDDIDYPAGDNGLVSLTSMKLEMHPQLNIPVTTEDAADIANLFNNGTSLTIELHNAHGGGSQLLIADGGITFDCGDMAHISYEWKEHPWRGTPGQMLATPVWSAKQAWDILDVGSKSPLTQEDLDKVITAFNDGWYPINEGYLRLQWSYRSGYTLTSVDKQNINSLLTYLFKYLGITLTDTSLT